MKNNFRFKNAYVSLSSILKISIFLCWLLWAVFYSLTVAINIPTFHLDGAFQTASGLYRLDAGQFPGKDFLPYLGIGPLLALYPFFKVFGGNISASVFSAQFIVLIFGLTSVAFIWHLIWRPKSFWSSLTAAGLLFFMPIGFSNYMSMQLPDWMSFQMSPGNSLRPLRAFAPYLIAITYYFFFFHIKLARNKYFFSGLLTGAILLWSNDFAIPSAGLFGVFIIASAIYRRQLQCRNVLIYSVTAVFAWAIFLALLTHGHPIKLLKYNFLDIAQDQWYFFGPYNESTRILSFKLIALLFSAETWLPLLTLTFLSFVAVKTKLIEHALLVLIGTVLFAGGTLTSIGGHVGGYFGGFYFWGMMVVCIGLANLAWFLLRYISALTTNYKLQTYNCVLLVLILFLSSGFMLTSIYNFKSDKVIASNDVNRFYVAELGGYLSKEWKDYIDLARRTNEPEVFEEYWGLWSATRKIFPAWPVDSVIHTLGSTRIKAASALENAKLIITTNEKGHSGWVGWNMSQSYYFYKDLIHNWSPVYNSPLTTVWRRTQRNQKLIEVPCKIVNKNQIMITTDRLGLLEIYIKYSVNGFRSLLLLENNFSFSVVSKGFVSLNPNVGNALIPAYAYKKGDNFFHSKFIPANRNTTSRIVSCKANLLLGNLIYGKSMLINSIYVEDDLTDENWVHGVARSFSGFVIPNRIDADQKYKVGRLVKFIDGESRQIMRVDPSEKYLNIYLSGDKLDSEKVGLPINFIVVDNSN
jgi:hypothetical protein